MTNKLVRNWVTSNSLEVIWNELLLNIYFDDRISIDMTLIKFTEHTKEKE